MGTLKVQDLSIGDWFCAISGTRETPPMRVVGLGESWVNLEIDPEQGDPFEFEPSEIMGIPITAEVLERNGFKKNGEYNEWNIGEWNDSPFIGVSLDRQSIRVKNFGADIFIEDRIVYVHQLQHALRLAKVGKEIEL